MSGATPATGIASEPGRSGPTGSTSATRERSGGPTNDLADERHRGRYGSNGARGESRATPGDAGPGSLLARPGQPLRGEHLESARERRRADGSGAPAPRVPALE